MNKKDVTELKRRIKIDQTTISRIAGAYVNGEKEILTTFSDSYWNFDEDEQFKYIDIASKSMSGTMGNNLLSLEFPAEEDGTSGGMSASLYALKESKLEDEGMLKSFYSHIIDNYDTIEHFLIVLFYDTYDIPMKTKDGMLLDDSEEVYDYIICAICPVKLTNGGLSYSPKENRIKTRIRDWVVSPVESAFVYPAFTDRSSDIDRKSVV